MTYHMQTESDAGNVNQCS